MTRRRSYLDWNATAPLRAEAHAAMMSALEHGGNASSVHAEGRRARALVSQARENLATLVGATVRQVVFTSGATEANAAALSPDLRRRGEVARPLRLLVSAVEHPSVLAGGRFAAAEIESLPVTPAGIVDLAHLGRRVQELTAQGIVPLVSVMAVNNETGVVQPIDEVVAVTREAGGIVHVDAVQAAGRAPLRFNDRGIDLMTLSSHKIGGPQGAGALVIGERVEFGAPLIRGGGQEGGMRAGTENVPAIAGFGAAAAAVALGVAQETARIAALRERLEKGLLEMASDAVIFGAEAPRVANTVLFAVKGVKAETALIALDLDGVAVSSGAACSSGKVARSHVLAAMGVPDALAAGAIRVSLGCATSDEDIEDFLRAWRKHAEALPTRQQGIAA